MPRSSHREKSVIHRTYIKHGAGLQLPLGYCSDMEKKNNLNIKYYYYKMRKQIPILLEFLF